MMQNCSRDPDRQAPATIPTISPQVYKEAYQLEQERRLLYSTSINGSNLFVVPSTAAVNKDVPDASCDLFKEDTILSSSKASGEPST
uniref:Uncharacterized protein n=1 Tax=Ditylenchus dipsaci TaxID=166011 RepID=A0A915E241_9BILA